MTDEQATFRVYVFLRRGHLYSTLRSAFALAYTSWLGDHACIHDVTAASGYEAKKIAKREHRDACGNRVTG